MVEKNDLNEMSDEEFKNLKIEFAPGCFDSFEGTQEELDKLVEEITQLFKSGEAKARAIPLDFDELDEEDLEILEKIEAAEQLAKGRNLQ